MRARLLDLLGYELRELVEAGPTLPAVIVWPGDPVRVFVRAPRVGDDGVRTYHEVRSLTLEDTRRGGILDLTKRPPDDQD